MSQSLVQNSTYGLLLWFVYQSNRSEAESEILTYRSRNADLLADRTISPHTKPLSEVEFMAAKLYDRALSALGTVPIAGWVASFVVTSLLYL